MNFRFMAVINEDIVVKFGTLICKRCSNEVPEDLLHHNTF